MQPVILPHVNELVALFACFACFLSVIVVGARLGASFEDCLFRVREYAVVCMLKERAQARIDDEDAKHREVALKAAETRRRKVQDLRDAYAYDAWLEIAMDQESYDDDEFVDDQSISDLEPPLEPEV